MLEARTQPAGQVQQRQSSRKQLVDTVEQVKPDINCLKPAGSRTSSSSRFVHAVHVDHVADIIADPTSRGLSRHETTYNRSMSRDGFAASRTPDKKPLSDIKIEAKADTEYTSAKRHPFEVKSRFD